MTEAALSPIRRGIGLAQVVTDRLRRAIHSGEYAEGCLLYTSDAADEL